MHWDRADHNWRFLTSCAEMEVVCVDAFVLVVVLATGVVGLAIVLADQNT